MVKKILVFADWFEPGFKAGGPIRSVVNFVQHMKDDYEIYVLTSDRDLGSQAPYEGIAADTWIKKDKFYLFYASPSFLQWGNIAVQIKSIAPHYVYLNSMFSKYFSIYPLLMKRLNKISGRLVLSPRGMLRESAIGFKTGKKKLFISTLKKFGVPGKIFFHATDETELADIKKYFGKNTSVTRAPNFPGLQGPFVQAPPKQQGKLKAVFVGRIHPIKNLHLLLEQLRNVKADVDLTIVGAIEDNQYWIMCRGMIDTLPSFVNVYLINDVPHCQIESIIQQHHIFVLPTMGENFGHSVFEALSAGRPVLISDQTPWRGLKEHKAGWDLPLDDPSVFTAVLNNAASMTAEELNEWCRGAWQYCNRFIHKSGIKEKYLNLFN